MIDACYNNISTCALAQSLAYTFADCYVRSWSFLLNERKSNLNSFIWELNACNYDISDYYQDVNTHVTPNISDTFPCKDTKNIPKKCMFCSKTCRVTLFALSCLDNGDLNGQNMQETDILNLEVSETKTGFRLYLVTLI